MSDCHLRSGNLLTGRIRSAVEPKYEKFIYLFQQDIVENFGWMSRLSEKGVRIM